MAIVNLSLARYKFSGPDLVKIGYSKAGYANPGEKEDVKPDSTGESVTKCASHCPSPYPKGVYPCP